MSKKIKNILIVSAVFVALFTSVTALAASDNVMFPNPLESPDIMTLIDKILGYAITVGAAVLVGMILVAAFQMLGAAGNPEKISVAKKTIMYSVIGYVIILVAKGLSSIIKEVLGVQ